MIAAAIRTMPSRDAATTYGRSADVGAENMIRNSLTNNRTGRRKLASEVSGRFSHHLTDQLRQDLAGFAVDDDRGKLIEWRWLGIDDAQFGAVLSCQPWNARRRVDMERAADEEHDVGRHRQRLRVAQCRHGKGLAEEDDGRLEEVAAACRAARRAVLAVHPVHLVARETGLTVEADNRVRRAMELDDLFTPRPLMQPVGVLRDHRPQVAQPLQLDQRAVRRIGLGVRTPMVEAVGPILRRILSKRLDVGDLIGIELGPEPAFAAEVRNVALYRDAGPGERDTGARAAQERRGLRDPRLGCGRHRSPAKRSSSGTGASTELRTRSTVSIAHAFGPSASLSFRNQLSSGIWVRCARIAPSFLSMNGLTSSQVVTRSSETAKGGGSPSVEKRFSTPARSIASAICFISDFGKAE